MNDSKDTVEKSLALQSDADLLAAWVRDQEQAAFAVLVRKYSAMVLSVCRRRCRNSNDADDAYQTTFLYLARKACSIRRPECLPGWLHRVAQRASMATITASEQSKSEMPDVPAKPDDPLDRLTQRHQAIVLDEELATLPEHYRAALVLHVYEGQPIAAMAEHFQTTVGSVRGRLQRGKQMLAQKLRRRGIVPVVAMAAASAWSASATAAAESSQNMIDLTSSGHLPRPPIPSGHLESYLMKDSSLLIGTNAMTSLYTAASLFGGAAIAIMMFAGGNNANQGTRVGQVVEIRQPIHERSDSIPAKIEATEKLLAQLGAEPDQHQGKGEVNPLQNPGDGNVAEKGKEDKVAAIGAMQQAKNDPPAQQMIKVPQLVESVAKSKVALQAIEMMDSEIEINFVGQVGNIEAELSNVLGLPVFLNRRAVQHAKLAPDAVFNVESKSIPARTALRRMLQPHGLRATIEDEGVVITADHAELAKRGIGVNSWILLPNELEKEISEKLDQKYDMKFKEIPLEEVVNTMSELSGIAMRLDVRSLEEIGISTDTMVSLDASKITMRRALNVIGRIMDLDYSIQDEEVVIVSVEHAQTQSALLARVYWMEATGFSGEDFDSLMNVIQTNLDTDMWEALGGPCTMTPVVSKRSGVMVSAPYTLHKKIESFFNTMRESNFGPDPKLEYVEVPAPPVQGIGGGFGGGFGGGGQGGFGGGGQGGGGGFF